MVTESRPAYPLLQILPASSHNASHFLSDPPLQVSRQDNLIEPHLRRVPRAPHIHPWTPLTLGSLQSPPRTHKYKPEAQES